MDSTITAAILGLLEGLTEFIPVSSTAHMLLAGHFLGFESTGRSFEVVVQLGAILALVTIYATKLGQIALNARHDEAARRTLVSLLLAFLPAVFIGAFLHKFIKEVLFETPILICVMLILGGIVLVFVDRIAPKVPSITDATKMPFGKSLAIGFCQCLAMMPGVSRSGATIVGALLMGVEKRAAAEFSFLLSMPTMTAAVVYDLYKNRDVLDFSAMSDIAVGFIAAFISAVLVVRWVLRYVGKHGYSIFGWWRIIVGSIALVALLTAG